MSKIRDTVYRTALNSHAQESPGSQIQFTELHLIPMHRKVQDSRYSLQNYLTHARKSPGSQIQSIELHLIPMHTKVQDPRYSTELHLIPMHMKVQDPRYSLQNCT